LAPSPLTKEWALDNCDLTRCTEILTWIDSERTKDFWTGNLFSYPVDPAAFLDHVRTGLTDSDSHQSFSVTRTATGELTAYFELAGIDRTNRSVRLSRFIVGPPDRRGKGVGRAILKLVTDEVFRLGWVHRFELRVATDNEPAIRCYLDTGFSLEGTMREARVRRDTKGAVHLMSLLEPEWEAAHSSYSS
jgi:RimJ/RimL family protein N-acetyltransferase